MPTSTCAAHANGAGSTKALHSRMTCWLHMRGHTAQPAVTSLGRLSTAKQWRPRHMQCAAELGEDSQLHRDSAAGQMEAMDANLRASTASASGGDPANVWDSKPPWCQPWTIVLTGAAIDAIAWKASGNSLLVTGIVGVPVALWWWLFLGVMPAQYAEYYQEQAAAAAEGRQDWQ